MTSAVRPEDKPTGQLQGLLKYSKRPWANRSWSPWATRTPPITNYRVRAGLCYLFHRVRMREQVNSKWCKISLCSSSKLAPRTRAAKFRLRRCCGDAIQHFLKSSMRRGTGPAANNAAIVRLVYRAWSCVLCRKQMRDRSACRRACGAAPLQQVP